MSAVGAGLAAHGLVAGHRVALMAPNSTEFVVAYFAVLRAGFVAAPINPQLTDTELRAVLRDCGAQGADRQRRSRHPRRALGALHP